MRTHVFADMMGYGRLVESRPAEEVVRLLMAYDRIVRAALPSKRAEVDRAADVFHLVFSTPSEAVLTAIKIAEAVGRHNARNPDLFMRVKYGIEAGQTVFQGSRYVGSAVITAFLLKSRAKHGQILVGEAVAALLRTAKIGRMRDLGVWRLPNGQVLHVHEARPPDLDVATTVETERFLSALLFTDIVASTASAASAGDRGWRDLVERHHQVIRDELQRHRGVEVDTAGDGFYATFGTPSWAIECAVAIRARVREVGVDVRIGIHVGECEIVAGKVGGIAVSLGSRVMAQAGAGEILVSQTVKDLMTGSGLQFIDRGQVSLKGVPGDWTLYAIAKAAPRRPKRTAR
jgi:class 3 adenylate cyclase